MRPESASAAAPFDPALVDIALAFARHGSHPADAEDIAQEALLKLVTHGPDVRRPVAWLFVVIHRLQQRRAARGAAQVSRTEATYDPWPETELLIDARRLIAFLPLAEREQLRLAVVGFNQRETAGRLGRSVKATEKSLRKARRRMRELRAIQTIR